MRKIKAIVVHYTVSPYSTRVADIDRWHREKGMRCIAYHRVIEHESTNGNPANPMKLVKEGRKLDNDNFLQSEEQGAHALGHNRDTIGVAVVAGPSNPPSAMQLRCLEMTLNILCKRHSLSHENVYGHRELKGHTSNGCPGNELLAFIKRYRSQGG